MKGMASNNYQYDMSYSDFHPIKHRHGVSAHARCRRCHSLVVCGTGVPVTLEIIYMNSSPKKYLKEAWIPLCITRAYPLRLKRN
jgi:hypothetical protein